MAHFYSAPNGYKINLNGKDSSPDTPIDLFVALSIVNSGDEIILEDTEWIFDRTIEINVPDNVVIRGNKPDKMPVLNFINMPYQEYDRDQTNNGINIHSNHFTLANIKIKNAPFRGIQNNGSYNKFNNIEISYCADCGMCMKGSYNIISNCYSHHNCDYKFFKRGEHKAGFNSDGFADKLYEGPGNVWINCISEFNADDGFDCFQRQTDEMHPSKFIFCTALNNGLEYLDLSQNERLLNDSEWNIKYDLHKWPCNGKGNGFKLGGKRDETPTNIHHVICQNCVSIHNCKDGFTENHNDGSVKLENCISVLNNENFRFYNSELTLYANNLHSYPPNINHIKCGHIEQFENINMLLKYGSANKTFDIPGRYKKEIEYDFESYLEK